MRENIGIIKSMAKENVMILIGISYMKGILNVAYIILEKKKMVKRMEKELNIIPTGKLHMKEIFLIITEMEKVNLIILMVL